MGTQVAPSTMGTKSFANRAKPTAAGRLKLPRIPIDSHTARRSRAGSRTISLNDGNRIRRRGSTYGAARGDVGVIDTDGSFDKTEARAKEVWEALTAA